MPKLAANRVPKYCRHKQSGQAVVYINGRDVLLGRYGSAESREKYDRTVSEWMYNGKRLPESNSEILVLEVIDRFWQFCQGYYRHPDGTSPAPSTRRIDGRRAGGSSATTSG